MQFLRLMPQLEGLELHEGHEHAINERILIQIADMPRLKYLGLGQLSTITRSVLERSTLKFSSLRNLTVINIEGLAARSLLPNLKHLQHLELHLGEGADISKDVLLPLQFCGGLISLHLYEYGNLHFTPVALETMAQANRKLRQLELIVDHTEYVRKCPGF